MVPILSDEENVAFLKEVASRIGSLYIWPSQSNGYSGKDLAGAKFPKTYDCSGLVTASLYAATNGRIDKRSTWNSSALMRNCLAVEKPQAGDLAFYGPSPGMVTHVMVYLGSSRAKETKAVYGFPEAWVVAGSSGGDSSTTDIDAAKKRDAKVTGYKSYKYRKDFIGFGRLVSTDR